MTDSRESNETLCTKCNAEPRRKGQRYGKKCHAEYQRGWRPLNFERKYSKRLEKLLKPTSTSPDRQEQSGNSFSASPICKA